MKPFEVGRQFISAARAGELVTEGAFPGQRDLKTWRLAQLEKAFRRNLRFCTTIVIGEFNGKQYLLDGQHRLTAVCNLGFSMEFFVTVEQMSTWKDLKARYAVCGIEMPRARANSLLALLPDDWKLTGSQTTAAAAGLSVIGSAFGSRSSAVTFSKDMHDVAAALMDYEDEIAAYWKAISLGRAEVRRHLRNAAAIAVALVTLRGQRKRAEVFWESIGRDSGLVKGDPAKELLDYLRSDRCRETKDVVERVRSVAPCWNAYLDSRQLHRITAQAEVSINGTEWEARRAIK